MKRTIVALGLLLAGVRSAAVGVCGDCNSDGTATVDELVTAVNYAVNGTGVPIITPRPDQCSASQPGQRLHAAGVDWIVVEVPVTLDDSPTQFALRYPEQLDKEGDLSGVSPRHLGRTCFPADFSCPYFLGALTSICGYPAATKADITFGSSSYYEATNDSTKKAYWNNYTFVRAEASIVVDPSYDSLRITLDFTQSTTADVSDISRFGYSLIRANYPKTTLNEESIRNDLNQLLSHVSLRPR